MAEPGTAELQTANDELREAINRVDGFCPHRRGRMRAGRAVLLALSLGFCGCAAANGGAAGGQSTRGSAFGKKGAPWTIRLLEIQGSQRVSSAAQIAETLKNTPGIRPADVFYQGDSDGVARLYYGTYYRQLDRKSGRHTTPPQLNSDLAFVKQLGDPAGQRYFFTAIPVRMPQPDVGDPRWNLANVDAKYSLQVAVFEPTDDFWEFKQAAVEYVKLLREKGYEAYYHHSPVSSVVTVGAFGPDALVKDSRGYTHYGEEVRRLQQDELLKHNLLNGRIYYVVEGGDRIPVPSSVVEVPRNAESRQNVE